MQYLYAQGTSTTSWTTSPMSRPSCPRRFSAMPRTSSRRTSPARSCSSTARRWRSACQHRGPQGHLLRPRRPRRHRFRGSEAGDPRDRLRRQCAALHQRRRRAAHRHPHRRFHEESELKPWISTTSKPSSICSKAPTSVVWSAERPDRIVIRRELRPSQRRCLPRSPRRRRSHRFPAGCRDRAAAKDKLTVITSPLVGPSTARPRPTIPLRRGGQHVEKDRFSASWKP